MRPVLRRTKKPAFTGWTGGDGVRKAGAPLSWPFGALPKEEALARALQQVLATQRKVRRRK